MMVQILKIPNRLPGLNDIIAACKVRRGKWTKYLDMKAQYGLELALLIKAQHICPVEKPVNITFKWCEKTARRDKDNIAAGKKFILDAFVEAGVLGGDDWRYINSFTDVFYKRDTDYIIVIIEEK